MTGVKYSVVIEKTRWRYWWHLEYETSGGYVSLERHRVWRWTSGWSFTRRGAIRAARRSVEDNERRDDKRREAASRKAEGERVALR